MTEKTGATALKNEAIKSLSIPEDVKEHLDSMLESLKSDARENLDAVIIYGSVARECYRPLKSDVNILILLNKINNEELDKIEFSLRRARRQFNGNPMIMTANEVERASDVFPVKFMHIKNYHITIHGDSVFEDLKINPEHIRTRLEQELRNMSIRLRNRYIGLHSDQTNAARLIANLSSPLAVQLRTLLELSGKQLPTGHTTSAHLEAAAKAFDLDEDALVEAARLRHEDKMPSKADQLFGKFMHSVDKAVEIVDKMEVGK